jgi:hypothetical protein
MIKVIFGLESSFKYLCGNLKWKLIKSFKHLNQIKQAGYISHVGCADFIGHADHVSCPDHVGSANCVSWANHVGHATWLHVGFINGNSIDYYDKSGKIKPF